jgi:hypothetical protein
MALTIQTAWALVDGATPLKEQAMTIQVLSKFWHDGKLLPIGTVLDMPELLVAELVNSHKAKCISQPIISQEVPDGTASLSRPSQSKKDVQGVD